MKWFLQCGRISCCGTFMYGFGALACEGVSTDHLVLVWDVCSNSDSVLF